MILALFDRLRVSQAESFEHIHGLVEATKRAFRARDRFVTDPDRIDGNLTHLLAPKFLDAEAAKIDMRKAARWPAPSGAGDTVWMGAADINRPRRLLHPVALLGIRLRLRAAGNRRADAEPRRRVFRSTPRRSNALEPGRRPFHTLNPALAALKDGRVMAYGTMGGDGQPQTQAALFTRHVNFGQPLEHGARCAALAARPHLGLVARQLAPRTALRRQSDRPTDVGRPRR